jgi:hypothetical protein
MMIRSRNSEIRVTPSNPLLLSREARVQQGKILDKLELAVMSLVMSLPSMVTVKIKPRQRKQRVQ